MKKQLSELKSKFRALRLRLRWCEEVLELINKEAIDSLGQFLLSRAVEKFSSAMEESQVFPSPNRNTRSSHGQMRYRKSFRRQINVA